MPKLPLELQSSSHNTSPTVASRALGELLLCGFGAFAMPHSVETLDSRRNPYAFMQSGGNRQENQDWQICKRSPYRRFQLEECFARSISKDELDARQENIDKMRYDLRRAKAGAPEEWKKLGGVQQTTPAYSTNIVLCTEFPRDVTEELLDAWQNVLDQIRKELRR